MRVFENTHASYHPAYIVLKSNRVLYMSLKLLNFIIIVHRKKYVFLSCFVAFCCVLTLVHISQIVDSKSKTKHFIFDTRYFISLTERGPWMTYDWCDISLRSKCQTSCQIYDIPISKADHRHPILASQKHSMFWYCIHIRWNDWVLEVWIKACKPW